VDVLSAVWGSVARVRELVTMRSGGAVRFRATGPEGAILLAPWAGGDRRTGVHGRRQASSLEVPLARRRAVIVDDDPAVVWFLSDLLQRAGVEVLEAHDGDRALDLVLEKVPDLVIADVLMPGRDGFSLARELKRDVAVRDVPVILLSWKEDLLERARELGADAEGYLLKEAAASVVLERVREVLRPRARIEARLQAGQEVRGRLDGLTPRLVLELACARGDDARVAFRDAAYLYEVEIRRGRPRSVTRTAPDGRFDRGEAALAGLLGAAAGRFVAPPAGGHALAISTRRWPRCSAPPSRAHARRFVPSRRSESPTWRRCRSTSRASTPTWLPRPETFGASCSGWAPASRPSRSSPMGRPRRASSPTSSPTSLDAAPSWPCSGQTARTSCASYRRRVRAARFRRRQSCPPLHRCSPSPSPPRRPSWAASGRRRRERSRWQRQ
jgi:DNA-binding response OmpR family regulator